MRKLAWTLLLSLATLAGADEPTPIVLEVGEERTPLGIMPRCDDLTVVTITADGRGVRGVRPGRTLCSFDTSGGGGARRVYSIVVTVPKPAAKDAPKGARG